MKTENIYLKKIVNVFGEKVRDFCSFLNDFDRKYTVF